jgi:uncharacterized protein (DUF1919 family)
MISIEGLRLKIRNNIIIPLTCRQRGEKLACKDFTIISNNCWGGTIYEAFNLKKMSPTVGLFFMAEDYIKFLSNLEEYLSIRLEFIKPEESKWREDKGLTADKRFGHYPIAKLKDIEIFFLHYKSEEEAREKWERRKKRINWDKLLVKFNDQNGCSIQNVKDFMDLPFKHKLFFTCKKWPEVRGDYIIVPQKGNYDHIMASYEPYKTEQYFDIVQIINDL